MTAAVTAPPRQPVLAGRGLVKHFGTTAAVRSVDLALVAGRTLVLLGPNGAGKSTTISLLAGGSRPDAGTVVRAGADGREPTVALVPQHLAFHPDLTGAENVGLFARLHGLRRRRVGPAVADALGFVGLAERGGDLAGHYSGGMQRRLNLAIALVTEPDVLLLDEPTEGVDPQSRAVIFERLAELRDHGVALLVTTHDLEDAEHMADDIVIMDEGGVIAAGTLDELRRASARRDRLRVRLGGPADGVARSLHGAGLEAVVEGDGTGDRLELLVDDGPAQLPALLDTIRRANADIVEVELRRTDLADLFLDLTGRGLRDGR